MDTIQFEWDNNKNAINIKKHKISFEEASTASLKICIVSHCYREDDEIFRIISARKATKTEQSVYEKNL